MGTPAEAHAELARGLEFPDFYGANLDALWDCLTGMIELPVAIEWRAFAVSREQMGPYADHLRDVFEEAAERDKRLEFRVT